MGNIAYKEDVIAWSREQARLLREGQWADLDIEHIADEIEDVGISEIRELESRMALLLMHLLKWVYQPAFRGSSWESTIRIQRHGIRRRLKRTPSLKPELSDQEWIDDVWGDARLMATKDTGIDKFPEQCPWRMETVIEDDFWPDRLPD
jgi:Domain of unknown function DUF29